jgi:hypothetical protein
MITEWAVLPEPAPLAVFANPSYATDIQFLSGTGGVVMVTPDNTKLFRVFIDIDGAIDQEFVAAFSGVIPDMFLPVPPFPVFGVVQKDILILDAASGILFPAGPASRVPRSFYRMRLDNDGTPGTEPVPSGTWMQIPENSIPAALDVNGNWVFTQDIQFVTPGMGLVMPKRGAGSGTRRIRIDFDGDIISE